MTINGVTPLGHHMIGGAVEERSTLPTATPPAAYEDRGITWEVQPRRRTLSSGALTSLRWQGLQNAPVARANTTPPGQHSTDSQLASELEKNYGELCSFLKDGRLTHMGLLSIAQLQLTGD